MLTERFLGLSDAGAVVLGEDSVKTKTWGQSRWSKGKRGLGGRNSMYRGQEAGESWYIWGPTKASICLGPRVGRAGPNSPQCHGASWAAWSRGHESHLNPEIQEWGSRKSYSQMRMFQRLWPLLSLDWMEGAAVDGSGISQSLVSSSELSRHCQEPGEIMEGPSRWAGGQTEPSNLIGRTEQSWG